MKRILSALTVLVMIFAMSGSVFAAGLPELPELPVLPEGSLEEPFISDVSDDVEGEFGGANDFADNSIAYSAGVVGGNIYYNILSDVKYGGDYIAITGCDDTVMSANIPAAINGVPVKVLATNSFKNKRITSITLAEGIAEIGESAFSGAMLSTLTLPSTVTKISYNSGYKMPNLRELTILAKDITWGTSSRWDSFFAECKQLTKVTINSTIVGDVAFQNCTSLYDVTFSENLISIDQGAFEGCSALKRLSLPNSIETIGGSAFTGCTNLTYLSLGKNLVWIGSEAFKDCVSLDSVVLPNNLTTLYSRAFMNCTSLKDITFPKDSLFEIQEYCFQNSGLVDVVIPDSVVTVGGSAFSYCPNLNSITTSKSMANVPLSLCFNCYNIKKITIAEGTVTIGDFAFGSSAMPNGQIIPVTIEEINLPKTIQRIGQAAFRYNGIHESVTINKVNIAACKDRWNDVVVEANNDNFLNAPTTYAEHDYQYKYDQNTHWRECTSCLAPVGSAEQHRFDSNGACTVCGFGRKLTPDDPHDHIFAEVVTSDYHGKECSLCGWGTDFGKHTLGEDGVCTVCNQIPPKGNTGYDVNNDGKVSSLDAVIILRHLAHLD